MQTYDIDDYFFDLQGYLILKNAIDPAHLAELNTAFDNFPDLETHEWWGHVQRRDTERLAGLELQNIIEAGPAFEKLIDHPAWVERMHRYCGEYESYVDGLFIDEAFATIRRTGGFLPMHSGGQDGVIRNQYRFVNGKFRCGQVNILIALTNIGPGDGGTRILPGSHKSNLAHPIFSKPLSERHQQDDEDVPGAVEVHLNAGDALLFVDALSHGATKRTTPGERRVVIYRYGPTWGFNRYGYQFSQELLDRVTPDQRRILQPIRPRVPTN